MNPNPAQRTRRLAARIAAIAVIALAPLAVTAGPALADTGEAAQISDSSDSFGDSNSWNGNDDFGWDDNGQYGYTDHNRQNYDGYEDHLNSGGNQYPDRDSHTDYDGDRGFDLPAGRDSEDHSGGSPSPATWNVPNPYIPPATPSLLPQIQLPQLPFALPGLPPLA
ncbi:hypothetical protein [Nocardia sp. NPDC003963]